MWSRFIGWIDRDAPFLQLQQLCAISPLLLTFIVPGPGTPAMFLAAGFWMVLNGIFMWRLFVLMRRRHRVDSMIRKRMWQRFRAGKGLPKIYTD